MKAWPSVAVDFWRDLAAACLIYSSMKQGAEVQLGGRKWGRQGHQEGVSTTVNKNNVESRCAVSDARTDEEQFLVEHVRNHFQNKTFLWHANSWTTEDCLHSAQTRMSFLSQTRWLNLCSECLYDSLSTWLMTWCIYTAFPRHLSDVHRHQFRPRLGIGTKRCYTDVLGQPLTDCFGL